MDANTNRREFLGAMALAPQVLGAHDTVRVGCIGTGGRCRALMKALLRIPEARIVAVADVWDENLAAAKDLAGNGALTFKDYRRLLERKDIDAVVIATPDHWHVPVLVEACSAGKDVYVEKPLTHDISEGTAAIEAQDRYNRVVQVGMQQRSMPHLQKVREIVRSGQIGKIHKAHLTWNRNSPRTERIRYNIDPATVDWKMFLGSAREQPFDEYRFRQWRWFWDFGNGILTDLMVHWIDTVHWIMDLDAPSSAVSLGNNFASKGVWETPDTIQTLLSYPKQDLQVYFEGTFVNARNGAMVELMGSEATIYFDRGRYEVHPERKRGSDGKVTTTHEYSEMILGTGPRGADFYDQPDGELLHMQDWIDAIRLRKKPVAPAEAGVKAAAAAHLGNRAFRTGQTALA